MFVFFNQKRAYEMLISAWSSGVCSSDLMRGAQVAQNRRQDGDREDFHRRDADRAAGIARARARGLAEAVGGLAHRERMAEHRLQIGRAAWRERVCKYV